MQLTSKVFHTLTQPFFNDKYIQHSDFPIAIQINDCKLALEGPVVYLDHYDVADPLSCKAVFQQLSCRKRVHHLKIYVIVHWSELNCISPSSQIPSQTNNCARLFHLLKLSHIFPAISNVSTSFVTILRFLASSCS